MIFVPYLKLCITPVALRQALDFVTAFTAYDLLIFARTIAGFAFLCASLHVLM